MIRKQNRIIAKLKSKYWIRTYKFGIEIPKSVEDANVIDQAIHNTNWWDSICKEVNIVRVAFKKYNEKQSGIPSRYTKNNYNLIFYVKMGGTF